MDFFSGSGTTADSIIQLSASDNDKRKFILVQLSEYLDNAYKNASNDRKVSFKRAIDLCDKNGVSHKLSEITKERIRRTGNKIKAESPLTTAELDTGFRLLKLDSTNINDVYYSPLELNQQMLLEHVENIKHDYTDIDLLFGCLLDWRIHFHMPKI